MGTESQTDPPFSLNSLLRAYIYIYRLLRAFVRGSGTGKRSVELENFLEEEKNAVTSNISVSWLRRGAPNSPASKALPNRDLSGFFFPKGGGQQVLQKSYANQSFWRVFIWCKTPFIKRNNRSTTVFLTSIIGFWNT